MGYQESDIVPAFDNSTKNQPSDKPADSPDQAAIQTVRVGQLMRYFSGCDKFTFFFAGFSAFVAGSAMPSMALLFGDLTDTFDPSN